MRFKASDICIFLGFFFISLAIFRGVDGTIWENAWLYSGYLFIMIPCYWRIIAGKRSILIKKLYLTALIWGLMALGVLIHSIAVEKKIQVLLSYFIIVSFMINGDGIIVQPSKLKVCSYAILCSFLTSFLLCLVMRVQWYTIPTEGLSYAVNVGLGHKNYAGAAALASLTGLYVGNVHPSSRDRFGMAISVILILVSGSRTVWIMTLIALVSVKSRFVVHFMQKHRILFTCIAILVSGVGLYIIHLYSQSFWFRFIGLTEYIAKYTSDWRLFLLGSADIVYSSERSYQLNLISAFGANIGTTEMGILNILVKSGFIGLLSYGVYFWIYFKSIRKTQNKDMLKMSLMIALPMIASSFSEPFIVNIKLVYTVFIWCAMSCMFRTSRFNKNRLGKE